MKPTHFVPIEVRHEGRQLSGVYSVTLSPEGRPEIRVWSQGRALRSPSPGLGFERQVAEAGLLYLHGAAPASGTPE